MDASAAPLTGQQVDKIENRMIASLAELMTAPQRERMQADLVAGFRALNAMGVQPGRSASIIGESGPEIAGFEFPRP